MAFIPPAAHRARTVRRFRTSTSNTLLFAARTGHARRATLAASAPPPAPQPSPGTPAPFRTPVPSAAKPISPPFNWLNQWYPAAWAEDVPLLQPIPFTLWQRNYVLYRDGPSGDFIAMDDVCPHRAAPLSEGRLYERPGPSGTPETILECGYHGWRFGCTGRCVDIPVTPVEKRIPAAADVRGVHATAVRLGLVFVWLGDRAAADEGKIPVPRRLIELERAGRLTLFRNTRRFFPFGYTTVLENSVDPAHVQWAHHGSGQGSREWVPRNGNLEVLDMVREDGYFVGGIRIGDAPDYRLKVSFQAPISVLYEVISSVLGPLFISTWVVPIDRDLSALFTVRAKIDVARWPRLMQKFTPRWYEHSLSNITFDGDTLLLQWQESYLQAQKRDGYGGAWKKVFTLASGTWDSLVVEIRRWLDDQAGFMPYVRPVSVDVPLQNLSRREVNDRYEHHVKYCSSCAPALRNMRTGRIAAYAGAGVSAAVTLASGIVCAALLGGGMAFLVRPLQVAAGAGFGACIALLLAGSVLGHFVELLTYTEAAYEASHAE